MPTHTQFKNVSSINQSLISDNLQTNLLQYFSWGFLNVGAFVNVVIPTSGSYGGDAHKLRLASREGYTNGQVWESFRKHWVWESGVERVGQPISISGVYINGTFYANNNNTFPFKIDYPNGRVIFNTAINTNSVVTCEYSYKYIAFDTPDAMWWKKLQDRSWRVDEFRAGSGYWAIPPEQRLQLPAVIVHTTPNESRSPIEIGTLAQWVDKETRFYICAETASELQFIHDAINEQNGKTLIGFDKNLMIQATGFPLNYDGSLATNAKSYPDLISLYRWKNIEIKDFRGWINNSPGGFDVVNNAPYYQATIQGVFRVNMP